MKQQKPILHSRDHEHGGADVLLVPWENVGTGGGGGSTPFPLLQAIVNGPAVSAGAGAGVALPFSPPSLSWIDFTDPTAPVFLQPGIYALTGSVLTGPGLSAGQGVAAWITAHGNDIYATAVQGSGSGTEPGMVLAHTSHFTAGTPFALHGYNYGSSTVTMKILTMTIVKIADAQP